MKYVTLRRMTVFVLVMLIIEFLDELTFGIMETAWPFIRNELGINYAQIGLLIGLPLFLANFIEPVFGLLADTRHRRLVLVGGGIVYGLTMLWIANTFSYPLMMLAFIVLMPAAGAFLGPAQASLMDHAPDRHDQNMARWTFAGSLGVVLGPIVLGLFVGQGASWRLPFALVGLAMIAAAIWVAVMPAHRALKVNGASHADDDEPERSMRENARLALIALRNRDVVRWLALLQFSDLMLDVLFSFLALYFVDVVGVSEEMAGIAVLVWTGVGLIGDFLLIPLLERVPGLAYLRVSVTAELILYPAFLLVDNLLVKLTILGVIGLFNAGWYSILSGRLYSSLPGQSGVALTVGNVAGLFGSLFRPIIGVVATAIGLQNAMWIVLLGPIALLIGLPRKTGNSEDPE